MHAACCLRRLGLRQGFVQVDEFRTLKLAYVFNLYSTASPELTLEMQSNRDVLRLPAGLTCLGKVIASIRHAATQAFDALVLSDDE